jgi:hypothetical protein
MSRTRRVYNDTHIDMMDARQYENKNVKHKIGWTRQYGNVNVKHDIGLSRLCKNKNVVLIPSYFHLSRLITVLVTRVTQRAPLVKQEMSPFQKT